MSGEGYVSTRGERIRKWPDKSCEFLYVGIQLDKYFGTSFGMKMT